MADLIRALEDQMPLRERGLKPHERMSATEPRVDHGQMTFPIPPEVVYGTGNLGTVEQYVSYLRHVNGIPEVAMEEMEREEPSGAVRVRFQWWRIVTWEKP